MPQTRSERAVGAEEWEWECGEGYRDRIALESGEKPERGRDENVRNWQEGFAGEQSGEKLRELRT